MIKNIDAIARIFYNKDTDYFEFYSEQDELHISIKHSVIQNLFDLYAPQNSFQGENTSIESFESISENDDDNQDIRERAMDRIAKLRQLSFNLNAADPNNEFQTVPAYLRRNVIVTEGQYVMTPDQSLEDHRERVFIYLPADKVSIIEAEAITNACGDFMEALEYELETENEPIFGSFLQNIWFKVKKGKQITQAEIETDFRKGKKALELKYVELPTAEQTEKLANSAAKIVELLETQDEGIVRLGAIIVLKKQVNGKSKIIVQQLNFELISILDKSPQLLQNLQTIYELLTGDVKGAASLDETGTTTITS